ncbi:MAG: Malate dehydrogenase (oxaloacetate-decarboxylating) Phosphate acetyltransferase [Gammaproteobacteria bacterium]|nr:Malate dehydrogenase (oxaloacetate-decarboxylating) Phosphate acetyltransferase [Gammaproteobacteria bacterium]
MELSSLTSLKPLVTLTPNELVQLLALGRKLVVPAGESIAEEGAKAESFFILVKGLVQVKKAGNHIAELGPGEFLGEMSLFNKNVRVCDLIAAEEVTLLEIPTDVFWIHVLQQDPLAVKVMGSLGNIMTERLQQQDAKMISMIDESDHNLAEMMAMFEPVKRQLMADWALKYHAIGRPGKLAITATKPSGNAADLSVAYSPGVSEPCLAIKNNPAHAYAYTTKGQLVGVITNGTAVLGLGNIGALAAKPVMEGKAILFKQFADIDAFDIEVDETDPDRFIDIVCALAPTFGGINLEDIRSPECFYIEQKCNERTDIPVFHDDQHGTAIIAGAALLNALEILGKKIAEIRVVFSGAGAAGFTCAKYFLSLGVLPANLIMTDVKGVVYKGRGDNNYLDAIAVDTHLRTLAEAMNGADVFMGASAPGVLKPEMLKSMNKNPVVFAMANPVPEIDYPVAIKARPDVIMGTGRSDYPNQINNVSAFPYIFRGALDTRAKCINEEMKHAATQALAALAREPITKDAGFEDDDLIFGRTYIIPKPFDRRLLINVSSAVAKAAMDTGVARKALDIDEYRQQLRALKQLKG